MNINFQIVNGQVTMDILNVNQKEYDNNNGFSEDDIKSIRHAMNKLKHYIDGYKMKRCNQKIIGYLDFNCDEYNVKFLSKTSDYMTTVMKHVVKKVEIEFPQMIDVYEDIQSNFYISIKDGRIMPLCDWKWEKNESPYFRYFNSCHDKNKEASETNLLFLPIECKMKIININTPFLSDVKAYYGNNKYNEILDVLENEEVRRFLITETEDDCKSLNLSVLLGEDDYGKELIINHKGSDFNVTFNFYNYNRYEKAMRIFDNMNDTATFIMEYINNV